MGTSSSLTFAPLVGHWTISADEVTYDAPQPEVGVPVGICLTSARFSDGTVTVRVKGGDKHEHGRIVLGFRSQADRYVMAGLGGHGFAYTIAELRPGIGWQPLAWAGAPSNLMPERWYTVRADVAGQRVQLFVDDVRLLNHVLAEPLIPGQVGFFGFGEAQVHFSSLEITPRRKTVFVVMQFSERYERLFREVVSPVASELNLHAYHAGEIFGPGLILKDIVQGIADARVIVADITPANQNVFYELGYAHALEKPVVILAERGKDLPFDLRGYRVLFYDDSTAGRDRLSQGLRRHLEVIVGEDYA